ncbi:MAG: hypothetical protein O6932_05200 [Gammaproteobacteria bacterium]|nr:hypothetical protein [Gammaproteobacteria bacterium]
MENEKAYLFDNPHNVKRILYILYGCCTVLFVLDFVILRHTSHSWENLWGFYAIYGFVGCVILVLVATWMRSFIMRPPDYYDDEGKAGLEDSTADELPKNDGAAVGGDDVDT